MGVIATGSRLAGWVWRLYVKTPGVGLLLGIASYPQTAAGYLGANISCIVQGSSQASSIYYVPLADFLSMHARAVKGCMFVAHSGRHCRN